MCQEAQSECCHAAAAAAAAALLLLACCCCVASAVAEAGLGGERDDAAFSATRTKKRRPPSASTCHRLASTDPAACDRSPLPPRRARACAAVFKLYRYGSFWLIKPKACTNQKVVRDTSCLTEIKASRSAFLVAKSAKSAKYRVFCGYTYLEKPGYTRVIPALLHGFAPGTTPTAATTNENPAYHFRIPLYHTTPKLIKISPCSLDQGGLEHLECS